MLVDICLEQCYSASSRLKRKLKVILNHIFDRFYLTSFHAISKNKVKTDFEGMTKVFCLAY